MHSIVPRLRLLVAAALITAAATGAPGPLRAQASGSDTAQVLSVVQSLFDAMAQRDTAAVRTLLVPGMSFVAVQADTTMQPMVQAADAFIRALGASRQVWLERFWSPVVMVTPAIATVWAPYDFRIDGRWSHCGIDTITLMRTASGWRIAALAYTVQMRGCDPGPL